MSARKTMDAQLPVPCAGSCASDGSPIVLEVLASGYLLNRQPVTEAALRETLRSVFDGRPEKIIQIAGQRDATYQSVLSAMEVARSAGVTVIAIPPSESYAAK
jgi:biopolymer transport protein ExbD